MRMMRGKAILANVLGAAVVVAVLGSSASALIISEEVTWTERTAILDVEGGFVEIVAGGHLIANARVDHDGGVDPAGRVILNGGDLTSTVDYKLPDNNTGDPSYLGILDGTFTANQIESFGTERLASIEIGASGTMIVQSGYLPDFSGQTEPEQRGNVAWLIDDGALYATPGLSLVVTDLTGGAVQVTAVPEPATLSLLGLGGLLLLMLRRRK